MIELVFLSLFYFAHASACEGILWSGEGRKIETCYHEGAKAQLSKSCFSKPCWSRQVMTGEKKSLNSKKDESRPVTRSTVCTRLGGTVLILGQVPSGAETAFCEGPDKTVVDINSLNSRYK